jgi:hypothetical protein
MVDLFGKRLNLILFIFFSRELMEMELDYIQYKAVRQRLADAETSHNSWSLAG